MGGADKIGKRIIISIKIKNKKIKNLKKKIKKKIK